MDIKRSSVFFLLILILLLGLAACERSLATNEPSSTESANPAGQPPSVTGDVMGQLEQFVTQTAMAGGAGPVVGAETTPMPAGGGEVTLPLVGNPGDTATATEAAPAAPVATTAAPAPVEPTAALVVVPTATPGLPGKYTLEKNEFPFCIARRFDINPTQLLNANGLGPNSLVGAGTVLKIPKGADPFPGKRALRSHPADHTVQAGETIYSIACLYGDADPNAIMYANGLQGPNDVKDGQTLYIP